MNELIKPDTNVAEVGVYLAACVAVGAITIEVAKKGIFGNTIGEHAKKIGSVVEFGRAIDIDAS